ncbi:MAG: GDP-L-fucose synthase [Hydrogenophaga sp.]|uniref:GDP-L-fucose synthase family protein n=1 Tax=Hydrogenophaga sp. TaxID=1904254 RepID=UPI002733F5E3|nr:GDP-L-fucose synthase [Hydrogenophaga sp.]MDP3349070.1 GDP-L-fucose synthase [Hydrogenophaga sp.]
MVKRGKLLITGGTGMVGRNICEHPLAHEWDVMAPGRRELDLSNSAAVLDYFEQERPDAVIHAAGRVGGIQANMAHPVDFLVQNVDLGRNIILAARAAGVQRLINVASSCMYPRAANNPLTEDLLLKGELEPTNEGYALAKIFATRLCEYIRRESPALHYKTLIPCNLYGRHDKFAPEHSHLLPAIIHKVHLAKTSGAPTVEIWGDGTARREFMYAGDVAEATLRAVVEIESLPDEMNVGLGHDYSINEYYAIAANVIGWKGQFVHDLTKPVGMKQKLVSIERQTAWGWLPKTTLEHGIGLAYRYYTKEYKP